MTDINSLTQVEMQSESLRERKKRLAQAAIEEAALRLFQQKGYEQTSIQDIADAVMMSSRTFFRYFASKEEVLVGIFHTAMNDGILSLKHIASTVSPHAALRVVLDYLASQYQQKRSSFLIRYQIAKQTPSISSLFLFAWSESEPALCDALCSHLGLETATSRNEMRFLVAIYMSALRVSMEEWLENDDNGELVPLLHGYMDRFLSLPFLS